MSLRKDKCAQEVMGKWLHDRRKESASKPCAVSFLWRGFHENLDMEFMYMRRTVKEAHRGTRNEVLERRQKNQYRLGNCVSR